MNLQHKPNHGCTDQRYACSVSIWDMVDFHPRMNRSAKMYCLSGNRISWSNGLVLIKGCAGLDAAVPPRLAAGSVAYGGAACQRAAAAPGSQPSITSLRSSLLMCGLTRVQVSMRPTMSVVLTPSVRLI